MTATAIIKSCPSITPNPYSPHFFSDVWTESNTFLYSKTDLMTSDMSKQMITAEEVCCGGVWGDPFFTLPGRGMGIAEWNQAFWATLFFLWVDKTEGQKCIRQFAATKGQVTLQRMRHLQRESHNLTCSDPWLHIPRILSHGILPLWNHCSQAVLLLAATYSLGLKKKITAQ